MANRLSKETSPYLLQHQHNPVDWYPWGPEAFEASRTLGRPIFLSVGYSTCYWCHVMERECFENADIAALMNEHFICIKVDREERPDVDQLYMAATQIMSRQGGWPMSVFLTTDLRPFYGGTYFPPTDMHGRPGFPTLLKAVHDAWTNRRAEVVKSSDEVFGYLSQVAGPDAVETFFTITPQVLDIWADRSTHGFDPQNGGFGTSPKFPQETLLEALLTWAKYEHAPAESRKDIGKMLRKTLDAMANGGIRDHLGGGFHRYSTDARWLVPHFEIMLYDNAMLARIYADASVVFDEPRYATVARGICDFVLREMTSPQGAFYSAFDAEVDAREGQNYLWTMEQIEQLLSPREASSFAIVYGLDRGPNFADPHHGTGKPDQNILYLPDGPVRENDPAIIALRQKLYTARQSRKQPLLDTKIITSWCAQMAGTLAEVGRILNEPRYMEAGCRAAQFLFDQHRMPDGALYRTSRDGVKKYAGFLDDYALLAQAMLACHRATGDAGWRERATQIVEQMNQRFYDDTEGGYFFSDQSADDLILRQKIGTDSPMPAGNALAVQVLIELGQTARAAQTLGAFVGQMNHHAGGMSAMVEAAMQYVMRAGELHVEPANAKTAVPSPQSQADDVVESTWTWASATTLHLQLSVRPPYHIYGPQAKEGQTPTSVSIDPPWQGQVKGIRWPIAEGGQYTDNTIVAVDFASPVPAGQTIVLRLRYQPCTEDHCLPIVARRLDIVKN